MLKRYRMISIFWRVLKSYRPSPFWIPKPFCTRSSNWTNYSSVLIKIKSPPPPPLVSYSWGDLSSKSSKTRGGGLLRGLFILIRTDGLCRARVRDSECLMESTIYRLSAASTRTPPTPKNAPVSKSGRRSRASSGVGSWSIVHFFSRSWKLIRSKLTDDGQETHPSIIMLLPVWWWMGLIDKAGNHSHSFWAWADGS